MTEYVNMKTCAVTGARYEAGDYVCKADFGTYIVKASVDYTPELRETTEAALKAIIAATASEAPREFTSETTNVLPERPRSRRFEQEPTPPSEG